MVTIGIFGPRDDQEVKALAARLRHRGAEPWIVDLAEIPKSTPIAWNREGCQVDGRPLLEMDAAFLRRLGTGLPQHLLYDVGTKKQDEATWREMRVESTRALEQGRRCQALRTAAVEALARRRLVINPPRDQNLHRLKTVMLEQLKAQGLRLPEFAVGTRPSTLSHFAHDASRKKWGGVVAKPLAGIYKTKLWSEEHHREHPWDRRPAFYQRYIQGDTIRCYLLKGQLLSAAKIVHGGTIDSSESQTGIDVIELESAAREVAEGTAEALELPFCGMDLMIDGQTGTPFIIDCNLSPMFVNYSRLSRCDIAGHLADHLISCVGRRGDSRRQEVLSLVDDAKSLLQSDPELKSLLSRRQRGR